MEQYSGLSSGGLLAGCFALVLVGLLLLGLVLVPTVLSNLNDAQADRDRAEAAKIEARAIADHQAAVDFRYDFMVWTAYIEANDLDLLLVVVVALVALSLGLLFGSGRLPWLKG